MTDVTTDESQFNQNLGSQLKYTLDTELSQIDNNRFHTISNQRDSVTDGQNFSELHNLHISTSSINVFKDSKSKHSVIKKNPKKLMKAFTH